MSGLQLVKFVDALTITGPGVAAGGAAGQVLTKKSGDNYDTEWKDGGAVGNMADLGIYIGNSQPPNMVSYDEWALNRAGYWAWWEISTAAVNAAINVPGSINSVTSGVVYLYPSSWANVVVPTDTQTILSGSVAVSATTIGTVAMPVIGQLLPITNGAVIVSSGNTVAAPGSAFTIYSGTVSVAAGSSSPVTVTVIGASIDITSGAVVISTSLVVPVSGTSLDITAGTVAVYVSEYVTISGSVVPISSGIVAVTAEGTPAASGPFTMDFSTGAQGLTDSLGTEWSKVVPTGYEILNGVTGDISSNQAGGYAGNCMVIAPSMLDDGDAQYDYLDTYITRSVVTINSGTITFRAKRSATNVKPFMSVNGVVTSFLPTVGSWVQCSVNVPSTLVGATIRLGVQKYATPSGSPTISFDSLSVP